jgi:Bacterial aa3 type cytochrome c oxidase subunit IV
MRRGNVRPRLPPPSPCSRTEKQAQNERKEKKMADQQVLATGHADMDYAEHERTYRRFLTLMKWGAIHCIVILIILAFLTL